ncbi:MAG: lasso peptide isopeptide bond-forming cyclase [Gemmatimonadaceae bacterium]
MSGIVGIFCRDGRPVEPSELNRMLAAIAHRGPDGSGCWLRDSTGLGHRLLWTTPESLRESLPLADETGELVITADARIDNREELIQWLDLKAGPAASISDCRLILHAYEKWGRRCPEKLLGDFAFAIWDGRLQAMFCARDHFGVKPFNYHLSERLFAFASEIKPLLPLLRTGRRLNELRIADYLVPMLEDKSITLYHDIFHLPPAHRLTVWPDRIEQDCYWCLDPSRELPAQSDGDYAEGFREIFLEAVRSRLRCSHPVGTMLSGGLDSSSITCAASQLLSADGGHPLRAFSLTFAEIPECDESAYIRSVVDKSGVESHLIRGDQLSPFAHLSTNGLVEKANESFYPVNESSHAADEPFYAPNLFLHSAMYSAAREQRVRVLLDGIDGDTTVSHGLFYLSELFASGKWITMMREANGLSRGLLQRPAAAVLYRYAVVPSLPGPVRTTWRKLRRRDQSSAINLLINREFVRDANIPERVTSLMGDRAIAPRTSREDHWRRLTSGNLTFALEVADKAAAAFSVEPRYPFFDKRLVEYCLALPARQKLNEGWTRSVMRRAMTGILPPDVQWRGGKSDLSPVVQRGMLKFDKPLLNELILNDPTPIEPYVDMPHLRKAYRRYTESRRDPSLSVWRAATLALLLRPN